MRNEGHPTEGSQNQTFRCQRSHMETQSKFIDSLYFEFSENLDKFVQDREIDQGTRRFVLELNLKI